MQEDVDEEWSLGIQIVDDATMQAAHHEFMDINEPTDIMTFPYTDDDDEWGENEPGGDLMISVDTARENARVAGWSLADEIFFLIAHGILHLLGWDDHAGIDRAAMLERQRVHLETWPGRP
jgi:probable rRNA maturation factor